MAIHPDTMGKWPTNENFEFNLFQNNNKFSSFVIPLYLYTKASSPKDFTQVSFDFHAEVAMP